MAVSLSNWIFYKLWIIDVNGATQKLNNICKFVNYFNNSEARVRDIYKNRKSEKS